MSGSVPPPADGAAAAVPRFVLASASPARRRLLEAAGIAAEVVVSGVDEEAITAATPAQRAVVLAAAKAHAVAARLAADREGEDALLLGCDSLLEFDGVEYGKPADAAQARRRWLRMAGGHGVLHTGHCLLRLHGGAVVAEQRELASTGVSFGTPDPAELDAYVATGEPLAVAGAFTLDGFGGWFVERIDGDHGTVLGLSLPLLRRMLRQAGPSPTAWWPPPATPAGGTPLDSPHQKGDGPCVPS